MRASEKMQTMAQNPGKEFYGLVESGVVGALFAGGWEERDDAVLVAPAYTFLMRNRAVGYQFWLDVGSSGWWERLYQPLTHPYVLSRIVAGAAALDRPGRVPRADSRACVDSSWD